MNVLGISPLTPAWISTRARGISGTDVAAILEVHPWKTQIEVWERIRSNSTFEPREQTEAMYWGNVLEGVVLREWELRSGRKSYTAPGLVADDELEWLLGTPDAFVMPERGSEAEFEVYEGKTGSAWKASDWDEGMPVPYALQLQTYLMITGAPRGHYAVLLGGQQFRFGEVEADLELHALLRKRLKDWWNDHIVQGVMPQPTARPEDRAVLDRLYPSDDGATVALPPSVQTDLESYFSAGITIRELEATRAETRNRILAALGTATYGISASFRASWKTDQSGKRRFSVTRRPTNP